MDGYAARYHELDAMQFQSDLWAQYKATQLKDEGGNGRWC